MIEAIINATAASLVSVAQANELHVGGKLIQTGYISRGGWFLNYVGKVYQPTGATTTDTFGNTVPVMAALPGIWLRLRINDDPPHKLINLMDDIKAAGGKVYLIKKIGANFVWSHDGITPAPAYIGDIGLIA
jgi:hypothetical protein